MVDSVQSHPTTFTEKLEAAEADRHREDVRVLLLELPEPALAHERRPIAIPDPFRAKAGHWIVWTGDVPFAIDFSGRSPVVEGHILTSESHNGAHMIVAKASPSAPTGIHYKYTLTMLYENGAERVLRAADPMGEIEPDPTLKSAYGS